ncbi:MAG: Ig-like domain-containing protein [Lachnospiraceae bacterium]|nr:Ig-like domain-containing protein [Lachnospiraceae bacterium]
MKNMKKIIAVALAATTAMSFVPVAPLGTPVAAYAQEKIVSAGDISLAIGDEKTYTVGTLSDFADGATVTATSSNSQVVHFIKKNGSSVAATDKLEGLKKNETFTVKTLKDGSAKITLKVVVNNETRDSEEFNITVSAKAQAIKASYLDENGKTVDATTGIVLGTSAGTKSKEITLKSRNFDSDQWSYVITGNTANSANKIHAGEIANSATDTATFTVTAGDVAASDEIIVSNGAKYIIIPVTVVGNVQTLTTRINGELVEDANNDGLYDQVIYLDDKTKTASISSESDFGTDISFTSNKDLVVVDNKGNVKLNGAAKDEHATITIKAAATKVSGKAVEPVTKTVKVEVSNKAQTTVSVKNSAGKTIVTGRKDTAEVTGSVLLSTKDLKEDTVTITSNVGDAYVIVESADSSIFTYKSGKLTAVKAGVSNLKVTVKNSDATTGTITFEIPVNVVDKYAKEIIKAGSDSVFLNTAHPIVTVKASTAYGSAVKYRLVTYNDTTKEYAEYQGQDVKLNAVTGDVTYVNQKNSGNLFVEVSTPSHAATEVEADKVYIPLTYSATKDASDLKAAAVLTLKVGETGSLGATATGPITYKSSDATIATVSADGTVTALTAGTVMITVKAAATDKLAEGQKIVPVVITEEEKAPVVVNNKPSAVKGLKVTNVKGAKVKVSYKKAKNTVGYQVYYKIGGSAYTKYTSKTTLNLKVKAGAKISVKVRAYNYKDNTVKQFGKYCAYKTLKTDKK